MALILSGHDCRMYYVNATQKLKFGKDLMKFRQGILVIRGGHVHKSKVLTRTHIEGTNSSPPDVTLALNRHGYDVCSSRRPVVDNI